MFKNFLPNRLATNISTLVVSENPQFSKRKDEIRYGMEWMISGINQILFVVLLSWPLGILVECMVVLLSGALLRMFSGGFHFKGYYPCLIFSTFQIVILTLICVQNIDLLLKSKNIMIFLLIMSFLIVAHRAPALHKKKHLFNRKEKLKLKLVSLCIFLLLVGISISLPYHLMYCVWLSLILQGFTLTKIWGKCVLFTDKVLYKIT